MKKQSGFDVLQFEIRYLKYQIEKLKVERDRLRFQYINNHLNKLKNKEDFQILKKKRKCKIK